MFDRLIDDRIRELIGDTVFYAPSAKVVADAQLTQTIEDVIEWGKEHCPHAGPPDDDPTQSKMYCNACWDTLKDRLKELKKGG